MSHSIPSMRSPYFGGALLPAGSLQHKPAGQLQPSGLSLSPTSHFPGEFHTRVQFFGKTQTKSGISQLISKLYPYAVEPWRDSSGCCQNFLQNA